MALWDMSIQASLYPVGRSFGEHFSQMFTESIV